MNHFYRTIPEQGNRAELVLTCLHRGNLQIDEFLGQVTLPLNEMDVYERPRQKSFKLLSKPGKEKKDKDRGELEVCIAFQVKSDFKGSLADLSGKKKGSTLGLGGSLLSLGTLEKRKGLKNFAKSMGSKLHLNKSKKDKTGGGGGGTDGGASVSGSISSIGTPGSEAFAPRRFGQVAGEADPGVVSDEDEDDDFVFDNLSHKSSGSSLNVRPGGVQALNSSAASATINSDHLTVPGSAVAAASSPNSASSVAAAATAEDIKLRSKTLPPSKPPRIASDPPASATDEWESKLYGKHLEIGSSDSLKRRSWESSRVPLSSTQEERDELTTQQAAGESPQLRRIGGGGGGGASHPSTAPTTPNLEDQKRAMVDAAAAAAAAAAEKPRPLPRSGTLESIEEKETAAAGATPTDKKEKSEKRFSKLKFLHKKEKAESLEDLKMKLGAGATIAGGLKQFGSSERVIIGHENDRRSGDVKVSPELLKKYDGKSREVSQKKKINNESFAQHNRFFFG